jgi:AraC family ethanolamine operon transcriptional activator
MPTHTFASPEAHAASVQNANLRIALLRKSSVPWTMSSLVLRNLRIQWGQAGGGNVVEGTVTPGGALIGVATKNAQVMRQNGRRLDVQTFTLQMPGDELCLSSTDWHCWFAMFIPIDVLAEWRGTGTMATVLSSRLIRVPWERAEAFRRVVAQLGSIVQEAPAAFESSKAVDTAARKLTESVRDAIWGQPVPTAQPGRQSISRRQVVRAAMDFIDMRDGDYLTMTDLASAAGVSERTLRAAFQEYFGMGPVRYLKFRTLNHIRKALKNADAAVTTVTGAATQFGVWELGRFARDYKLLFGELPSETLRNVQ